MIQETEDGFLLSVRVTPGASRNEILPPQPGEACLRVKVTAPPEDGKANAAVIKLLSKTLRLPKSAITLVRGATSREKVFQLQAGTLDPALFQNF